jgi:hypothetical protein
VSDWESGSPPGVQLRFQPVGQTIGRHGTHVKALLFSLVWVLDITGPACFAKGTLSHSTFDPQPLKRRLPQAAAPANESRKVSLSEQTGVFGASTMLAIPCSLAHRRQGSRDNALAALHVVESPKSGCARAIPRK